jgi:hypothetical protein
VRTIAILFFGLAAGCTAVKQAPPAVAPQAGPVAVAPPSATPPPAPVVAPLPAAPPPPASKDEAVKTEPVVSAAPPPSRSQSAKPAPPPVKAPAQASAPAVAAEPAPKSEKPAAVPKAQEPPLDVAALTARLRDTQAIGTFTKLALKNQVDDLLKQFRAHYQSGRKASVDSLRQPYNMLILKVLSLLQDSDPALARTISASREAIWSILADPEKFNSLT